MPRPKGSKNKAKYAVCTNIMSFRFTDEVYSWVNSQPNKTEYIRELIIKDMKERGIIKEED